MVGMGYSREDINDSLTKMKYDDITAAYLLLGRHAAEAEVSESSKPFQSPAHLLNHRSSSKQRRHSDQGNQQNHNQSHNVMLTDRLQAVTPVSPSQSVHRPLGGSSHQEESQCKQLQRRR
uniref:MAP/microtubule affinity-regulating kinase 3-like n=1 Tax=Gasterosteus aculeatus aculeatus TaxID=481459 RepID=UPI001A97E575|nr:MAP/microtubule affinity-regulating kinase 3-like [Gasterosteus aculeatus aculeatus]